MWWCITSIVFCGVPFDPEWHKWEDKTTDDIIILPEENISWIRLSLQIYFAKLNTEIMLPTVLLKFYTAKVHRKKNIKKKNLSSKERVGVKQHLTKKKSQIFKTLIIYCLFSIPFLQRLRAGVLFLPVNTQIPLSFAKIWVSPAIRDTPEHQRHNPDHRYDTGLVCGLSKEAARGHKEYLRRS